MPDPITLSALSPPAVAEPLRAPPEKQSAPTQALSSGFPNPALSLDPGLGVVVLEFRGSDGSVKSSIPSKQQLDAYRALDRTGGTRDNPLAPLPATSA